MLIYLFVAREGYIKHIIMARKRMSVVLFVRQFPSQSMIVIKLTRSLPASLDGWGFHIKRNGYRRAVCGDVFRVVQAADIQIISFFGSYKITSPPPIFTL